MSTIDRRTFLIETASGVAAAALIGCKSAPEAASAASAAAVEFAKPPLARPTDWNPMAYNIARGKAGFIPEKYLADILAPDGDKKHLGKHLPYVADLPADRRVTGYVPLMWGDPSKGYAKHPNAPINEANPMGHWYSWIRISIAGQEGSEVETSFDNWPLTSAQANGKLTGLASADPAEDAGKNTVYLAQLPAGAKSGDVLRIWAHCLTHGEYVDFLTLA